VIDEQEIPLLKHLPHLPKNEIFAILYGTGGLSVRKNGFRSHLKSQAAATNKSAHIRCPTNYA
jgi:hypothetical protein